MTKECILCLGSDWKQKILTNIVFNFEKKLIGIEKPYSTKVVHEECLTHFLRHIPQSTMPSLFAFPVKAMYYDFKEGVMKEGAKPVWFLSKPIKFFIASGSRYNGSFEFDFGWLRNVYGIAQTKRVEIPASVKKLLPNQCEVCGSKQNLDTHHKIPLSLGGSNERENLRVLCKTCHSNSPIDLPPNVTFDFAKLLREILEKEYEIKIPYYPYIRRALHTV